MQRAIGGGEAFNGAHIRAIAHHGERRARLHAFAIHMHHAGAALAGIAADMRAGHAELFAQQFHQKCAAFNFSGMGLTIHGQSHLRHSASPNQCFYPGLFAWGCFDPKPHP